MGINTLNNESSELTINSAYTFPPADGIAGQVVTTDGAGTAGWRSVSTTGSQGKVVQFTEKKYNTYVSYNPVVIPFSDTAPTASNTSSHMTISYTPKAVGNLLLLEFNGVFTVPQDTTVSFVVPCIFKGTNILHCVMNLNSSTGMKNYCLNYIDVATTTAATSYVIRVGRGKDNRLTFYHCGDAASRKFGGTLTSVFTITELEP